MLGPGHFWPYFLIPICGLLELIPYTRAHARRRGLVYRDEMLAALVSAVEHPPDWGRRIWDFAKVYAQA